MSSARLVAIVVVYVLVMLGVGWVAMRRTKDAQDFFIGGRTLGPWMSAFAYGTTYFSAVLFIGYAGKLGWGFGIHTMWIVVGNTVVGTLAAWWLLAGRTRDMTARLDAHHHARVPRAPATARAACRSSRRWWCSSSSSPTRPRC